MGTYRPTAGVSIWAPRPRNRRPGAVGVQLATFRQSVHVSAGFGLRGSPRTRYLAPPGYLRASVPALLSDGLEEAFSLSSTMLRNSAIDRALSTPVEAAAAALGCRSR